MEIQDYRIPLHPCTYKYHASKIKYDNAPAAGL